MPRLTLLLAVAALGACASAAPPAASATFGVGVANEAVALAAARTPGEKSLVLLDILGHRVEQMETAAKSGQRNLLASLANAYRRLALEALPANLASAGPQDSRAAREILSAHEARLGRIAGARDAFLACRFVLESLVP